MWLLMSHAKPIKNKADFPRSHHSFARVTFWLASSPLALLWHGGGPAPLGEQRQVQWGQEVGRWWVRAGCCSRDEFASLLLLWMQEPLCPNTDTDCPSKFCKHWSFFFFFLISYSTRFSSPWCNLSMDPLAMSVRFIAQQILNGSVCTKRRKSGLL